MAIIWDDIEETYSIGGHKFDRSEFPGNLPSRAIEAQEEARLNLLLKNIRGGREVKIHIENRGNNKGYSVLTKPIGGNPVTGRWWESPII
jgi:hypothetical protein